jgi:hypothetical protein
MRRGVVFGCLCFLLLGALLPVQAITLRYSLKKGATVQYTVRMAAVSRASGMGSTKSESTIEMTTVYRLKVNDVGTAGDMLASLEQITGTVKITENDETKQTSLPKGKPLQLRITPLGAIRVIGPEDWRAEADKTEASFGVGSSTPTLDLLSAASIVPLPEGDVKPGESWENDFTETLPMPPLPGADESKRVGQVKVKSQLLELVEHKGRKCARIKTNYEMPFEAQGTPGRSVTINISGKMTGSIDWFYDYSKSCTVSCVSSLQLLLKTSADLPPELQEHIPAGVDMNGTLSMKANLKAALNK